MDSLVSRHLTTLKVVVDFGGMLDFGTTIAGRLRFAPVSGGTLSGDRLSGTVLPGGGDWVTNRADGAMLVDVRLPLRTHDGAMIALRYHGSMLRADEYTLRTVASFATGDARYVWLNDAVVIGVSGPTTADTQYVLHELG
jgi:hypothetical protein